MGSCPQTRIKAARRQMVSSSVNDMKKVCNLVKYTYITKNLSGVRVRR